MYASVGFVDGVVKSGYWHCVPKREHFRSSLTQAEILHCKVSRIIFYPLNKLQKTPSTFKIHYQLLLFHLKNPPKPKRQKIHLINNTVKFVVFGIDELSVETIVYLLDIGEIELAVGE